MGKYIKCPRCELNWIKEEDEYCDVCKAEMGIEGFTLLDDDEDEMLCPVCGVNYIEHGEKMCAECRAKKAEDSDMFDGEEDSQQNSNIDEEENIEKISFDELDEEEKLDMYDEAFDDQDDFSANDFSDDDTTVVGDDDFEEEEEEESVSEDDIEDDFNYDIDSVDTSDLDEEEEEEDEDEEDL